VFRDDQRLRFGEVKDLPGDMVRRHRRGQRRAARRAGRWIMIDGDIGCFGPAQRLPRMALLTAGLLARRLPQAADAGRLLQPVARWRLAAVAAVQLKPALQLGDLRPQRRHLNRVARLLRQQQRDEVVVRELAERGTIHRLLGIDNPPHCQTKSMPPLPLTYHIWGAQLSRRIVAGLRLRTCAVTKKPIDFQPLSWTLRIFHETSIKSMRYAKQAVSGKLLK